MMDSCQESTEVSQHKYRVELRKDSQWGSGIIISSSVMLAVPSSM